MANRPSITEQFDPEQIYQIIEEYLSIVGRRQYTGARYVPIFGRVGEDSIEWDNTAPYEPLTIVLYQGNSYTSRQYVPAGIEITNEAFWACTGNYNAQIEAYRREVLDYTEMVNDFAEMLPASDFDENNTVKDYVDAGVSESKDYTDDKVSEALEKAGNLGNFYFIEAEKIAELNVPSGVAIQGCTASDTHIYCFFTQHGSNPTTPYLAKYDANLEEVGRVYFSEQPNVGHGNSITYDPVNDCIVILSSNGYMTCVSQTLEVLSYRSLGSSSQAKTWSQIAMTDQYAILNFSSSNQYAFYKRISDGMFAMYGMCDYPLARGTKNMNQDCFMRSNMFYAMGSTTGSATYLDTFAINGQYTARFIIGNTSEEMEGCFVFDGKVYLIAAFGNVYTFDATILNDANSQYNVWCSSMVPVVTRALPAASIASAWFKDEIEKCVKYVTYDGSHTFPQKVAHVANGFYNPYLDRNERFNFGGVNRWGVSCTGSQAIRIYSFPSGNRTIAIGFTPSGNYQYLSSISAVDIVANQVVSNKSFTDNDPDFSTKLNAFFTEASMSKTSFEMQGCTPLGNIQAQFLPIILE